MKRCISQITGYQHLVSYVEHQRKTHYSSDNEQHEALLMQVFTLPDNTDTLHSTHCLTVSIVDPLNVNVNQKPGYQ